MGNIDRTINEMKDYAEKVGLVFEDDRDERRFLDTVIEELEVRIGEELSSNCSPEELEERKSITDLEELGNWIERTVPYWRVIVSRQIERMKADIKEYADFISTEKKNKERQESKD